MQKRRYPLLSERFEREALATLQLAERIGREYVMLANGDIVPRARTTPVRDTGGQPATAERTDGPTH